MTDETIIPWSQRAEDIEEMVGLASKMMDLLGLRMVYAFDCDDETPDRDDFDQDLEDASPPERLANAAFLIKYNAMEYELGSSFDRELLDRLTRLLTEAITSAEEMETDVHFTTAIDAALMAALDAADSIVSGIENGPFKISRYHPMEH